MIDIWPTTSILFRIPGRYCITRMWGLPICISAVSAAGDLTSHTMTADGYVVVNKLKSTNGTIQLEIPQNSIGDWFLRRWANWQKNSQDPSRVALGTLTIQDSAGGFSVVCTGVTLQKVPDRVFDRTATNLVYTLLATTITEQ